MEETLKLKAKLERTRTELGILYEISNAMRTTLKLDEILYIILTGVTAHIGLGFNRAILFLVNEKDGLIEGKMAIGPDSGEEANRAWTRIEQEKMGLEELINAFKSGNHVYETTLSRQVRSLKISLSDKEEPLLTLVTQEGLPLHLKGETIQQYASSAIIKLLNCDEVVLIPLKAKDRVNGIIVADNFITHEPVTKDDLRMLTMLANQAGLAIENSQLYEKALVRMHTDPLTELWNHGYFHYLLQSEAEKAKATKIPLSLILVDIDDFKVYNDALGHQAGDKILKNLALLLKNQSRKMDYVCRYGGEEFSLILPQADKKEAFLIAERLREDIRNYAFAREEVLPTKRLTVSIGVATFPADGATPSELISSADKAMYQAKRKGKNNTCCS
jgi:diguanylate cyclase (GGDEF)-like protein